MRSLLLLLIIISSLAAADPPPTALPTGLTVSLEIDHQPVIWGESWILHYVVRNKGTTPFKVDSSFGTCDDVRLSRHRGMLIDGVGPGGETGEDPLSWSRDSYAMCSSYAYSIWTLAPGDEFVVDLHPREYVRITKPGRWHLRVFVDLDFNIPRTATDPRWADIDVDVIFPDAKQAEQVVKDQERGLEYGGGSEGKRGLAGADWKALELPAYQNPLERRALAGSIFAVQGLASIPGGESSNSLLKVLALNPVLPLPHSEAKRIFLCHSLCEAALQAMDKRVDPDGVPRKPFSRRVEPRLAGSLDADQRASLRKRLLELICVDDQYVRGAAATILAKLATPACIDAIMNGLEKASLADQNTSALDVFRLLDALDSADGNWWPTDIETPAHALAWLHRLKLSVVKPKDWEQKLGRLLDHHLATVHEVAMDAVPAPWPTLFMPQLREGLSDMCSRVRWIACCRAGETGDRSLIPLLQAQVADEFCGSFAAASIAQLNKSK